MEGAIVRSGPKAESIDSPIPKPIVRDVLIKVAYAGRNPNGWKLSRLQKGTSQLWLYIAAIVEAVADNVT
jgi:NADPH:quinone reductase-like Zn-dependent oxidoreductase